jgi:hypothetical protein
MSRVARWRTMDIRRRLSQLRARNLSGGNSCHDLEICYRQVATRNHNGWRMDNMLKHTGTGSTRSPQGSHFLLTTTCFRQVRRRTVRHTAQRWLLGAVVLSGCWLGTNCESAHAATSSWILSQGGEWNDEANWFGGVPQQAGDTAVVGPTITELNSVIHVPSTITLDELRVSGIRPLTISGAPIIFHADDASVLNVLPSANVEIQNSLGVTGSGRLAMNVSNGAALRLGGIESATTGYFLKQGAGELSISGIWNGTIQVDEGKVDIDQSAQFESVVVDGGTLGGNGRLATNSQLVELRKGTIHFQDDDSTGIPGPTTVSKRQHTDGTITNLGTASSASIEVNEGRLFLSQWIKVSLEPSPVFVSPKHAQVRIDRWNEFIALSDSVGYAQHGGLAISETLGGEVRLESGQSIIAAATSSRATVDRLVGGGGVTLAQGVLDLFSDSPYSGATELGIPGRSPATLSVRNASRLSGTSQVVLNQFAILELENTIGTQAVNLSDRLSDTAPLHLRGGTFRYVATEQESSEQLGPLRVEQGRSNFTGRNRALLTAESLTRDGGGVIKFDVGLNARLGQGSQLLLMEAPTLTNQMIGAWAITGDDFSSYHPTWGVVPLYQTVTKVSSLSAAQPTSHVELIGEQPTPTANRTVASLTSDLGGADWDLGGRQIAVTSGGWIHVNGGVVRNGSITAGGAVGSNELILHTRSNSAQNRLDLQAAIVDNGQAPVGLTVAGFVTLSGQNSYTGPTQVLSEQTIVTARQAVPERTPLNLNGGTLWLNFQSQQPVTLGVVRLSQQGKLFGGEPNGLGPPDQVSVDALEYVVESGELEANLVGNGPLRKLSKGEFKLMGENRQYSGSIDILDGILFAGSSSIRQAQRALGMGVTTVHPNGLLVHASVADDAQRNTLTAQIELAGGEIAVADVNGIQEWVFDGSIRQTAPSTIGLYNALAGTPLGSDAKMRFVGEVDLGLNQTTTFLGSGSFSFENLLRLGGTTRWNLDAATARIEGTVVATANFTTLNLVGTSTPVMDASIEVPAGTSLDLQSSEQSLALQLDSSSRHLKGSGTLVNPVSFSNSARIQPGDEVGQLTVQGSVTLGPGSVLVWQLSDPLGTPGQGWDQLKSLDAIHFASEPNNPFTLSIEGAGALVFDPQRDYRWTVAEALRVDGFDPTTTSIQATALRQTFGIPEHARFWLEASATKVDLIYSAGLTGDFNRDGTLDVIDITLLGDAIQAGSDLDFDLDHDQEVSRTDWEFWVHELKNTYFGDANLDGSFARG